VRIPLCLEREGQHIKNKAKSGGSSIVVRRFLDGCVLWCHKMQTKKQTKRRSVLGLEGWEVGRLVVGGAAERNLGALGA
jgi:hypothetical protein